MDLLVRIDNAASCAIWEAEYDGLCRRIAKVVDGKRTEYFWDGDRLAADIAPGGRVRLYLYPSIDALSPIGFIDYATLKAEPVEGAAYFVFVDQIGLPQVVEDAIGNVAWRARSVDPYGLVEVAPNSRVAFDMRYPGHILDPETGLHDNRFRTYSPGLGRYLQSDPIGQSGGINLYAYTPNPLSYVDVLGLHDGKAPLDTGGEKPAKSGPVSEFTEPAGGATAGAGDVKKVYIDPDKYPEQAQHIADAQESGQPSVLTVDRQGAKENRKESLAGVPTSPGKDRDEYPPAISQEGGAGASVRPINSSDNRGAGASMGNQLRDVPDGGKFQLNSWKETRCLISLRGGQEKRGCPHSKAT